MLREKLKVRISRAGYKQGFTIENIHFNLYSQDIVLITGPSASGKSTLLKSINGLLKIMGGFIEGEVFLNDENVLVKPVNYTSMMIPYMPQDPWHGVVGYTVLSEYCHALSIHGYMCKPSRLYDFGFTNPGQQVTYGLSAGLYQRLLWAEILDSNPPVVLMDEPYTYLDQESRVAFRKFIDEYIDSNGSIIVVDHIVENWVDYEPYTIVLNNGRVVYQGGFKLVEGSAWFERGRGRVRSFNDDIVLIVDNVWFKYPGSKPVLKGVNLEVYRGEITGVRGVNGAGKTTLLKIISGVLKPWKGRVVVYGRLSYVPENPLLYFTHPTPRGELTSSCSNVDLIEDIVDYMGLRGVLDKPLAYLSSGERRRVALASAFLSGSDLILLDEPTGGLDKYSVEAIMDIVDHLSRRGVSFIIAHHDPRLNNLMDKDCVLSDGVLKCQ